MGASNTYAETWKQDGAVLVPGLIEPDRLPELRRMAEWCLSQWHQENPETGKPGLFENVHLIFHINRPCYFSTNPELLRLLLELTADPKILGILEDILDGKPMFRHTTLLKNPTQFEDEGNWHRDSQFLSKTDEEERALIGQGGASPLRSVQVQVALVPSEHVEFVPGSYSRWDTDEEYRIRKENNGENSRTDAMPGASRPSLQPGDALFFSGFGLHRGRYFVNDYRRTLMLTYGLQGQDPVAVAQDVEFFTHQPWFLEDGYMDGLSEGARSFFQTFIDAHKDEWLRKMAG